MQKLRIIKDEVDIKVVENFIQSWNNFFVESQNFVSILIVKEVFDDVKNDLMCVFKIGEEVYQLFKKE